VFNEERPRFAKSINIPLSPNFGRTVPAITEIFVSRRHKPVDLPWSPSLGSVEAHGHFAQRSGWSARLQQRGWG